MMLQTKLLGMFMMNYVMAVLFDTDWKAEIFKRLDALSEKLGVAAGHLWAVLVRQAYAEAFQAIAVSLLATLWIVVFLRLYVKTKRQTPDWEEWQIGQGAPVVIMGIGSIISIIIIGWNLPDAIVQLINPEYFALQKILALFGK